MAKLFHYCPKNNTVLSDGLYSVSGAGQGVLNKYFVRSGCSSREGVLLWLEQSFEGRSRSVSCLTEEIQWQGNDPMLKNMVENMDLYSFDLDELVCDGLVEAIYCKDGSGPNGEDEKIFKILPEQIDYSPLCWHKCCRERGMLFGVVRHYLLVLKDGLIPPKYLKKEG